MYQKPTFRDILRARKRIAPYLAKTPLHYYASLSKILGFEAYVKHENFQPTGSFKVRGGINLISQLTPEEGSRGVITASTGNHGQSIAYAARLFGVKAYICVSENANPDKVESIKNLGGEIIAKGRDFEDARLNAEKLAKDYGYRYIHSGNEPHLISGVGTIALEIIEDLPDLDAIIAPVGGGSQVAGISTVVESIAPSIEVIAVQAEKAPSVYLSWKEGRIIETDSANTIADGLATRRAFELPLEIMRGKVDDFVLVSEEEIKNAIRMYVEKAHTIAEGAGAAPLAAGLKIRDRLQGKKVALILSGGNLTANMLREILSGRV
ncbi:threonine/serine dehydratase [Candidatus Bathyarchaeota archaeon]|nr:threonine/serine dehydratase [Candidatus Bathyarchaeota archaeon]MBS7630342.1 threonine/serine dehydratase [Candidatus Bathyarchaeota archaeon]